jgi:hypothetical protein
MSGPYVRRSLLLCLLTAAPLPGCSRIAHLTPSEQASFGTRTFAAPLAATGQAARERITTVRRPVGAQASIGLDGRSVTPVYMQFDLRLLPVDGAHTRVVAVPHQYAGERDISRERTWELDGDQGLHSHWRALFKAIEANLRR